MPTKHAYTVQHIDANWNAVHQATLIFVTQNERVLLIRKKRGLGAGKINGPGGKLDSGETAQVCAHRELFEELGIRVSESENRGRLRFQFMDGYSIDVQVFVSQTYVGVPTETEEAVPLWCNIEPFNSAAK